MKKKIVGICVCMLLIAIAIPAVTSIKNTAVNATKPNTPQTCMSGGWIQMQKLITSDGNANDMFGVQGDLEGNTVLIGAAGDDSSKGAVYAFIRNGTTWTEQAKLVASDGAAGDFFCSFVALDGDNALIGAANNDDKGTDSGSAYIFTRSGATWTQQAKLLASDGAAGDSFGYATAIDGDTALIGAYNDDDKGSVYVFTHSGATWIEQQKLLASDGAADDLFGSYVFLDSDTALIGACGDDDLGADSGSVYVFTRSGTTWTQQKLVASDGQAGDAFGASLWLDGDTALIGADKNDDNGVDSGSAYVFIYNGTTWTEQQKLLPSDGAAGDKFSLYDATLDGDTALIPAPMDDDNGANSGSAYIFTRTGTTWTEQQKLLASDGAIGDQFGPCRLDGDTAVLTAWADDNGNGIGAGSAYIFTKSNLTFDIKGGLGVKIVITNNGITNITNVSCQLHIEGGILGMINKTVNETVDIPVGESVTVKTEMLFGFGAISITARVADIEQTFKGIQIIIFSMVK